MPYESLVISHPHSFGSFRSSCAAVTRASQATSPAVRRCPAPCLARRGSSGQAGRKALSPWAQAKVWALTTVSDEHDLNLTQDEIASKVWEVGSPRRHPSRVAIQQLQTAFAEDDDWYPGKAMESSAKRGPKRKFTPRKRRAIAQAAEALKEDGVEPTVNNVRERCPSASVNPDTDEYFDKKSIFDVSKTDCYDNGARAPWGHLAPRSKTALSDDLKAFRHDWAKAQLALGNSPGWYFRNCIWVDPNYTILTTDPRAVFDAKQASFGKNKLRWISPDKRISSRNLRASPYAGKQARGGDRKVWWHIVVARGIVHYELMGSEWEQNGEGQAAFIDGLARSLPGLVDDGDTLPRVVFSDRGPGFYAPIGYINHEYADALRRHGFRPYAGDDAREQPPDVPDCLPHERAAAWTKEWMSKHPIPRAGGLDKMEAMVKVRLRQCAAHINENHDVDALCRRFPKTMRELKKAKGERLRG